MRRFSFFLLGVLLLPGCALLSRSVEVDGISTYDGISDRYPTLARHMAGQAVSEFSRRYPPGRTSVGLVMAPGAFGEALDSGLRSMGFVVQPPEQGGLRVGYVLDEVSGDASAYVRVRVSDGTSFGAVRTLADDSLAVPGQVLPVPAPATVPWTPEPSVTVTSLNSDTATNTTADIPITGSASAPVPTTPGDGQNMLLPKAVLTVLPYNWRYTIPDEAKRNARVSWPKNIPWREAVQRMATESGCVAAFDESARRITLTASGPVPVASRPVAPVSALHPASLPEKSSPVAHALKDAAREQVATTNTLLAPVLPVSEPATGTKQAVPESGMSPALAEENLSGEVVSAPVSEETWALEPGSLYTQLGRWADQAGYQLVWRATDDLEMESATVFRGAFLKAVQELFHGLARTGHNLRVTIYQTNNVMEVRGE